MEHLLNPSGDGTYVPFARSQIKALRAAGQRYAARRWEMGQGWTVAERRHMRGLLVELRTAAEQDPPGWADATPAR